MFYDELRKRPKETVVSIDEHRKGADSDHDADGYQIADNKAQPDENLERRDTLVSIDSALKQLPEQFRKVIVLREFYGLTYEEIALRTKVEVGTLKSRIARAKSKMQSQLKQLNCA